MKKQSVIKASEYKKMAAANRAAVAKMTNAEIVKAYVSQLEAEIKSLKAELKKRG